MSISLRRILIVACSLALGASIAPAVFADGPTMAPGLTGEYFDNEDFTGHSVQRVDPNVDFEWEGNAPIDGIESHTFSVRWTGTITPRHSERYTFTTQSDDGIRVIIDGQTVIEDWSTHSVETNTGEIDLEADTAYDITVEFYEHLGRAEVSLGWQSASQAAEIVPGDRLAHTVPATPTDTTPTGTGTGATGTIPVTSTPAVTSITPAADPAPPVPEADFPAPSTPIAGQTFVAEPIRGEVLVRTANGVRRLSRARTLPIGIRLDTRRGAVRIDTAKARGVKRSKQYARISGGTFKVGQPADGDRVVSLDLTHGDFEDCSPQSPVSRRGARTAARKTGNDKVRSLWGHGKGRFRTVGRDPAGDQPGCPARRHAVRARRARSRPLPATTTRRGSGTITRRSSTW